MKTYLCKPKKEDKRTKILVGGLGAFAFAVFFLSIRFLQIKPILQLIAALLLLLMIQIANRFLLTEYRYGFENGHLVLSTRQGKREKSLGGIPLTAETKIFDQKTWEQEKEKYSVTARFSYCQNMSPAKPYYLLAPEGKGFMLLIFEPDETLVGLLNENLVTLRSFQ